MQLGSEGPIPQVIIVIIMFVQHSGRRCQSLCSVLCVRINVLSPRHNPEKLAVVAHTHPTPSRPNPHQEDAAAQRPESRALAKPGLEPP